MNKETLNVQVIFQDIRNYLAGRATGLTRDRALLDEVVKCIFCSISLPKIDFTSVIDVSKQYRNTFSELKKKLPFIFNKNEELLLDPQSLYYVAEKLSNIDYTSSEKDVLSELYQCFISSDLRQVDGQFFTPIEAIKFLVEFISPQKGQKIIDPACGTGGFLSYCAKFLKRNNIGNSTIKECIYGIDKDEYLTSLSKLHLAITTLNDSNIKCLDSIEYLIQDKSNFDKFDIVVANPPFGAKIKSGSFEAKKEFDLTYKWKFDKKSNLYIKTSELQKNTPPQVMFLELCIKLLKDGGKLGIVVPESLISSSSGYIVQYLMDNIKIDAICGMPESLFKTSGKGGTHTKTCLVVGTKRNCKSQDNYKIFMAEASWCGHDSRGNIIPFNDLPTILDNYRNKKDDSNLGYYVNSVNIKNYILAPRYYNPSANDKLESLKETHDIFLMDKLISDGVVSLSTGDEVGKLAYGTGKIPFVRTSDISNWEIKLDTKQGVSEEIYNTLKDKQDVQAGDILMVKDGTYLIGTCAFISEYDTKIVYQSHLYKIRVNKPEILSPYLLLASLSSQPVIEQIKSKRLTLDIIDSIGKRINELLLPIPKNKEKRAAIENMVKTSINDRIEARELARKAKIMIIDQ